MTGKGRGIKAPSLSDITAFPDLERVGVAYGGSDNTKSREEIFVREVDDDDLKTRHFELRHSREGKIVPMRIWKKTMTPEINKPLPPLTPCVPRRPKHVRNFSHKSSGDSATGHYFQVPEQQLLQTERGRPHVASQYLPNKLEPMRFTFPEMKPPPLQPNSQQHLQPKTYEPAPNPKEGGESRLDDASTLKPTNLQPQPQPPPQLYLLPTQYQRSPDLNEGRGSLLDFSSTEESEEEKYAVDKPPWNDIRSAPMSASKRSRCESPTPSSGLGGDTGRRDRSNSRSTSEETLQLPRMESRDFV